jgi:hypothetical protein
MFLNSLICRPNWRAGHCTQGFPTAGLSTASNRETESVRARRPKRSFAPGARTNRNVASLPRSIREQVRRQVLKMQETLMFWAQLASAIFLSRPSMHRCLRMSPIERHRLALSQQRLHACDSRFGQARKSRRRCCWPSPRTRRRGVPPLSLFGHAQKQRRRDVAIVAAVFRFEPLFESVACG